jgi:hypothetical protein
VEHGEVDEVGGGVDGAEAPLDAGDLRGRATADEGERAGVGQEQRAQRPRLAQHGAHLAGDARIAGHAARGVDHRERERLDALDAGPVDAEAGGVDLGAGFEERRATGRWRCDSARCVSA